jgi:hypothetical protein
MTGNIIGIAVHVQLTMVVAMAERRHPKMKRPKPQAERYGRRRSKWN